MATKHTRTEPPTQRGRRVSRCVCISPTPHTTYRVRARGRGRGWGWACMPACPCRGGACGARAPVVYACTRAPLFGRTWVFESRSSHTRDDSRFCHRSTSPRGAGRRSALAFQPIPPAAAPCSLAHVYGRPSLLRSVCRVVSYRRLRHCVTASRPPSLAGRHIVLLQFRQPFGPSPHHRVPRFGSDRRKDSHD